MFEPHSLELKIAEMCEAIASAQKADYKQRGYSEIEAKPVVSKERKKFIAVDIGGSGAFLVEKETGEIYNIKGYGVPDYNKKRKANLGNIFTADLSGLYARRWNYLR